MHNSILDVSQLALRLQQGGAALFPTDTLPALGTCPEHCSQLWEIKRRPSNKPLILLGSNPDELFVYISSLAIDDAQLMASKYWPGPLTLVLPAKGKIVNNLNPGQSTIGIRVPGSTITRALLEASGPLATTSANISGFAPALEVEEIANLFPELPLLGPLPWPISSGLASTVISWQDSGCWKILRSGAVIPEVIE